MVNMIDEIEVGLGDIELDWVVLPALKDFKSDFEEATPYHQEQQTKINNWLDNLNVEGNAKIKKRKGRSSVVPKLIRKQAEWRFAPLSEPFLSTKSLFKVKPTSWEDREAAAQNEIVLNYQFNTKIDKNRLVDEAVRANVEEGTVFFRTGWMFKEEEVITVEPVYEYQIDPSMQPILAEIGQLKENNLNLFETNVPDELKKALEASMETGTPIRAIQVGEEEVKSMKTVLNHPTVEVCNNANITVDPTCNGDLKKAGFIVYSYESSLSELKESSGRYFNLDLINVTSSSVLNEPDHESSLGVGNFTYNDDARKKFVVFEYWGFRDIDGNGMVKPIVCSWVNNTIIELRENPYPDKELPFVAVQYLPVRKSVYGEPDGELLEDNQKIIGAVTRGMIDSLGRSANGQTGIKKGMLDPTNRRKYERGEDYEFNPQVNPQEGVHMHTFPDIPSSAEYMYSMMNMEAESLTGVKAFSGGLSGDSYGDVATAVRGVLDAASKRELAILRRLGDGFIQVGKKIAAMNGEFLSEEETVRISNEQFVKIRRDELAGEFDFELTISTAEEDNAKAERLEFMLQTMGNTLDFSITKFLLEQIATLRKMPELAHKVKVFKPKPDPMQEQIQQLEIQKLQAEIAEIASRTQENYSSAKLDESKANTEGAKAGDIAADTNKKALDFVQEESGVNQERELQKQKAQSQGNIELENHKAALEQGKEQREIEKEFDQTLLKSYLSKPSTNQ